jgi:hypothetical protein
MVAHTYTSCGVCVVDMDHGRRIATSIIRSKELPPNLPERRMQSPVLTDDRAPLARRRRRRHRRRLAAGWRADHVRHGPF